MGTRKQTELTPAEVAAILGVNAATVRRWIADGTLPARRVGWRYRIAPKDLARVQVRA